MSEKVSPISAINLDNKKPGLSLGPTSHKHLFYKCLKFDQSKVFEEINVKKCRQNTMKHKSLNWIFDLRVVWTTELILIKKQGGTELGQA